MSSLFVDWMKIVECFEESFKIAFENLDKKAHFDNLPDQYKVIDGAKLMWCHLLLVDAMIYLLLNDSVNSSCRRAFNQHRLLVECIIKTVESANPEIFALLISEKNLDSLRVGQRNYDVISDPLFQRLTGKFGPMIKHGSLISPWRSVNDMRLSFANGPTSKAKGKYFVITELLLNHEVFNRFQNSMRAIIQQVIHRALFKYRSSSPVVTSPVPVPVPVPVISFAGVATKKQKRVHTISDDNMYKTLANFRPSQIPRYEHSLNLVGPANNSVTSVMHLAISVPVQCPNSVLIRSNRDSSPTVRECGEVAINMEFELKEEKVLRNGTEVETNATQSMVPLTIQRCGSEDLCGDLPMAFSRDDLASFSACFSTKDSASSCETDEDFEIYDDDVSIPSNFVDDNCMPSQLFNIHDAYEALGCQPSPLLVDHHLPGQFVPVSPPPQSVQLHPPTSMMVTINATTSNYILHDNVLCAVVPVYDPRLVAAASRIENSFYQGEIFGVERATDIMNNRSRSQSIVDNKSPRGSMDMTMTREMATTSAQKMPTMQTTGGSPTSVSFISSAEMDESLKWLDDCDGRDFVWW